jgi:hypothetical protein
LHHVRDELVHFIERELLAVLAGSKRWAGAALQVIGIHMGTNRIRYELCCPRVGGKAIHLDFEEHAGQLVAGIGMLSNGLAESWLARLRPAQMAALSDALAGFYTLAGVTRVREHLKDAAAEVPRFDQVALAWTEWVGVWQRDQAGKADTAVLLAGESLLPFQRQS